MTIEVDKDIPLIDLGGVYRMVKCVSLGHQIFTGVKTEDLKMIVILIDKNTGNEKMRFGTKEQLHFDHDEWYPEEETKN